VRHAHTPPEPLTQSDYYAFGSARGRATSVVRVTSDEAHALSLTCCVLDCCCCCCAHGHLHFPSHHSTCLRACCCCFCLSRLLSRIALSDQPPLPLNPSRRARTTSIHVQLTASTHHPSTNQPYAYRYTFALLSASHYHRAFSLTLAPPLLSFTTARRRTYARSLEDMQ
jgi:hypothetical protein